MLFAPRRALALIVLWPLIATPSPALRHHRRLVHALRDECCWQERHLTRSPQGHEYTFEEQADPAPGPDPSHDAATVVDAVEVQAALAEDEELHHRSIGNDPRLPPMLKQLYLRIGETLTCWLENPAQVTVREWVAAEQLIRLAGEWRIEQFGFDELAEARARRLDLLERLQAQAAQAARSAQNAESLVATVLTKSSQIASDHSPGRGTFPRWGIETGWGGDAHSPAMTPDTIAAAEIFARNLKAAMTAAAAPLDYNAGVARTLGVKPKLVSEWVNAHAIASHPHQRALEHAFQKPFGWFTADHETQS